MGEMCAIVVNTYMYYCGREFRVITLCESVHVTWSSHMSQIPENPPHLIYTQYFYLKAKPC